MSKIINPKEEARLAISTFVRGSIPMLRACLELTAQGIPETDKKGNVLRDENGCVRWASRPDPASALKTTIGLVDFYMPKMTTSQVNTQSLSVVATTADLRNASKEQLLEMRNSMLSPSDHEALTIDAESTNEGTDDK